MEKILTIIIPTYNMEKYLDKCLTSLIINDKVLFESFEVLVVIDGAKDRSSEIAHSYETRFPQVFRVIDKENGNYGSCINRGVAEAIGKYVKVLDADDYFDTSEFIKYLQAVKEIDVDLILNDCTKVDEKGLSVGRFSITGLRQNEMVPFSSIYKRAVWFQMHCVAYRTALVRSIGYKQTERISYTDQQWVARPMSVVKTAQFVKADLYRYLVGREGQSMDINVLNKKFQDEETMIFDILSWTRIQPIGEVEHKYLVEKTIHHLSYLYYNHIIEHAYDKVEFRDFSARLRTDYPEIVSLLELQPVFSGVNYKFVEKYHKNVNYVLPKGILVKIQWAKRRKRMRIFIGNILRKIGVRA